MASFFITSCGGECGGDACSTTSVCPDGYYCAVLGQSDAPSNARPEKACESGNCIKDGYYFLVETVETVETGEPGATGATGATGAKEPDIECARCDPGYAISFWKDDYKSSIGSEDCEFVQEECPTYCVEDKDIGVGEECVETNFNCDVEFALWSIDCKDSAGVEYTWDYYPYSICSDIVYSLCPNRDSGNGGDSGDTDLDSLLPGCFPKGIVAGQDTKTCCYYERAQCPNPCGGYECIDEECAAGQKCRSDVNCPYCDDEVEGGGGGGGGGEEEEEEGGGGVPGDGDSSTPVP